MSMNKNKYWEVTTTRIVTAPSKSEALRVIARKSGVQGKVLSTATSVDRIPASEAHYLVDEMASV